MTYPLSCALDFVLFLFFSFEIRLVRIAPFYQLSCPIPIRRPPHLMHDFVSIPS